MLPPSGAQGSVAGTTNSTNTDWTYYTNWTASEAGTHDEVEELHITPTDDGSSQAACGAGLRLRPLMRMSQAGQAYEQAAGVVDGGARAQGNRPPTLLVNGNPTGLLWAAEATPTGADTPVGMRGRHGTMPGIACGATPRASATRTSLLAENAARHDDASRSVASVATLPVSNPGASGWGGAAMPT
jgi:hypothetical protein